MLSAVLYQTGFRYRNDDGSESGASWSHALNEQVANHQPGQEFRLRIAMTEQNGETVRNSAYSLLAKINGGSWLSTGDANYPFVLFNSTWITGSEPTTQQISSGGFVPGYLLEAGGTQAQITITSNASTEYELAIMLDLAKYNSAYFDGDTIEIAMAFDDLSLFGSYLETPVVTVAPVTKFSKLYLGGQKINEFYLGGNLVPQIFLGSQEVYRNQ